MVENFCIWKTCDVPAYPPTGYGFLWGTISPTVPQPRQNPLFYPGVFATCANPYRSEERLNPSFDLRQTPEGWRAWACKSFWILAWSKKGCLV
jgi:hypothetical protein